MDKLVPMTSADGRMLEVHSSCVHAHERAGWRVAAQADAAAIKRTLAAAADLEAAARVRNGLTDATPAQAEAGSPSDIAAAASPAQSEAAASASEQQKKGGKAAAKE